VTQRLDQGRALRRNAQPTSTAPEPRIESLLEIDREYRTAAAAGALPTIAPRRFNPEGKAWLPVLHARRGDWQFTALYSNTARAHELDRVHDWVVLYGVDKDHAERHYTVVTASRGALAGRRVVRGREGECRAWYATR
jgi:DNA polymerase (family 10)